MAASHATLLQQYFLNPWSKIILSKKKMDKVTIKIDGGRCWWDWCSAAACIAANLKKSLQCCPLCFADHVSFVFTQSPPGSPEKFPAQSQSDAAAPADDCRWNCTLCHQLVEYMQHLAADTEGTYASSVNRICSFPSCGQPQCCIFSLVVVQLNTQVSLVLHHLHLLSW